jgi:hypothetical protein
MFFRDILKSSTHRWLQKTYTPTNLYNPQLLSEMQGFLETIEAAKDKHTEEIPLNTETVLMVSWEDDELKTSFECYYYLVDQENRILFWLNDFDATDMLKEIDGATELSHIRE